MDFLFRYRTYSRGRTSLSRIILAFLSILVIPPLLGQAREKVLAERLFPVLKTIQEKAVKAAPDVLSERLGLAASDANAVVAAAGTKPNVGGDLQYFLQRERRLDLPAPTTSSRIYYNISVSQPVFHWGALKAAKKIGEIQVEISKGRVNEAIKTLEGQIRSQFMSLVEQKMSIRNAELALKMAKEDLEQTKVKIANKQLPGGAVVGAQYSVDGAQLALDRAKSDFGFALKFFRKLTGINDLKARSIPDSFPDLKMDKAKAEAVVGVNDSVDSVAGPQVKNAQREIEKEKENLRIQKVRLRPNFDLLGGYRQDQESYTANIGNKVGTKTWYIGIGVQWNIFDGHATRGEVAASRARIRSLELKQQQLSEQLQIQADQLHQNVLFAAEALHIANFQKAGAFGGLSYAEDNFKRGLASKRDVENARKSAYDQELSTAKAEADFLNLMGQYLSLVGEDPIVNELTKSVP